MRPSRTRGSAVVPGRTNSARDRGSHTGPTAARREDGPSRPIPPARRAERQTADAELRVELRDRQLGEHAALRPVPADGGDTNLVPARREVEREPVWVHAGVAAVGEAKLVLNRSRARVFPSSSIAATVKSTRRARAAAGDGSSMPTMTAADGARSRGAGIATIRMVRPRA